LAYVKSYRRFLGFRCNAFQEDPEWQLICAATLPEAKMCRHTAGSQKSDFELAETQLIIYWQCWP